MTPRCWLAALSPDLHLPPVTEIKRRLDGSRVEFACHACAITPGKRAAVLHRIDRDWHFPQVDLTIPAGSISFGYFWTNRPFNLYHWMAPSGETIGDYFNLAGETTITSRIIEWLDLVVDYCLVPGRAGVFLDEDELPDGLDRAIYQQIEAGRRELISNAQRFAQHLDQVSRHFLAQINQYEK